MIKEPPPTVNEIKIKVKNPSGTSYLHLSRLSRLKEGFRLLILTRAAFLFAVLMLANVIAYLYHMIMARMMPPADYGVLVTLMSVSYVLDVMLRTVQAWLTKTVSEVHEKSTGQVHAIFKRSIRVLTLIAVVVIVVQAVASRWIADFLQMDSAFPVVLLGLYAALHFLVPIPRGVLLGLGQLQRSSATIVLEPIVRLIVGVVLVIFGLQVNGAMGGYAVGSLLSFALGLFLIRPILALDRSADHGKTPIQGIDRYAFMVLIVNICLMIMASVDQIFVKRYFSPEIAGNYAVTFVLGRVIVMTAISLGITVFTRSTSMVGDNPRRGIVLAKGMLVLFGISAATLLATLAAPDLIVRLIAGSQYGMAQLYIRLVCIEMTLFGLVYVQAYFHISINNTKVIWALLAAMILEIGLLTIFHASVQQMLLVLISIMAGLLITMTGFTWHQLRIKDPSHHAAQAAKPVEI